MSHTHANRVKEKRREKNDFEHQTEKSITTQYKMYTLKFI